MNHRILYKGVVIGVCSPPYGETSVDPRGSKFKADRVLLHMDSAQKLTDRMWNLWSMEGFPFAVVSPDGTVWEGCWFAGWLNTTTDEGVMVVERATIVYAEKGGGSRDWLEKFALQHRVPMNVLFPEEGHGRE